MFKTDFKNDKLLVAENTKRKYRVIDNGDETVSFEDVTVYEQKGDPFGADEVNAIHGALNESFQSVSNGKTLMASAITDKGVPTDATATFAQMATNIKNIQTNPIITKVYDDSVVANGATSATTTALSYNVQSSGQYIICASSDGSAQDSYYFRDSSDCQIRKNGNTIATASNRKTATSTGYGGANQGVTSAWAGELSEGDTISLYGYIQAFDGYRVGLYAHMQIYKIG